MKLGKYEISIGFCDNLAGSMMSGIIEKGDEFRFVPMMFFLISLILVIIFYV